MTQVKIFGSQGGPNRSARSRHKVIAYRNPCIDGLGILIHPSGMQPTNSSVGLEFLRTEVETAMSFARIASDAQDPQKRLRNIRNARKGYDTLLHFTQTLALTPDAQAELHLKIAEVRQQLINLGENV